VGDDGPSSERPQAEQTGVISGTPSTKPAPGSYPIQVKVTDSKEKGKQTATATLTLQIS
jgi:putative Ig domain-containing protein